MNWLPRMRENCWPKTDAAEIDLNRHCPALDGIRGLAVLLVLCYDCLKLAPSSNPAILVVRRIASSGWIGVDLFFVLSGFLITGILLETVGQPGYWKSFLVRRGLRIFPLYYATLLSVLIVLPWLAEHFAIDSAFAVPIGEARRDWLWYALYGENWLFALRETWPAEGFLKHFWSLAVEEQFYLVWPLVVAVFSRRMLMRVCLILAATALFLRIWLLTNGAPPMVVHVLTLTRMDSLCIGALLAVVLRDVNWRIWWGPRLPLLALGSAAVVGIVDIRWSILKSEAFAAYTIGHTLTAGMFALMIGAAAVVPTRHLFAQLLSRPPLIFLGKYSYAIYVFHRFVYHAVMACDWSGIPESLRGWCIFGATLLGSLLAARVSWICIESPCLSMKRYFPRPAAKETVLPDFCGSSAVREGSPTLEMPGGHRLQTDVPALAVAMRGGDS